MLASPKSPESGTTALATNPAALVGVVLAIVVLVLVVRLLAGYRHRRAAAAYARQLTEAENTGSVVGATVVPTGRGRTRAAHDDEPAYADETPHADGTPDVDETAPADETPDTDGTPCVDGTAPVDASASEAVEPVAVGPVAVGPVVVGPVVVGPSAVEPVAVASSAVEPSAIAVVDGAETLERRRLPRRRALREERKGRRSSRGRRAGDLDQSLLAHSPHSEPVGGGAEIPHQPSVRSVIETRLAAVVGSRRQSAGSRQESTVALPPVSVVQVDRVEDRSPGIQMVDVAPVAGEARPPHPRSDERVASVDLFAPVDPAPVFGSVPVAAVARVAVVAPVAAVVEAAPAAPAVLRPEDLIDPIDLLDPMDLLDPVDPIDPIEPIEPIDRIVSMDPIDPIDPSGPSDPVDVGPFVSAPIFGADTCEPPTSPNCGGPMPTDLTDLTDPTNPTTHLDQGSLAEPHRSDDLGGSPADRNDEEIWQMTAPSQEAGAGAGVVTDAHTEVSATMRQVAVSLPQVTGLVEHSGIVQPLTPDSEASSDGTSWAAAPAQAWPSTSAEDAGRPDAAPAAAAPAPTVAPAPAPASAPVAPAPAPAPTAARSTAPRSNWWDNDGQATTPAPATTTSAVDAALAISQAYAPRVERQGATAAVAGSSFGKVVLDFEPRTPNEDGEEVVNRIVSQILASVGVDPAAVARHQSLDEMPDWSFDAPRVPSQRGVTPSSRQRDGLRRSAKRLSTSATRASAAQITAEEAALLVDGDVAAVVVHSVEGPRVLWLHPDGGDSQIWGPQTLSALLAAGAPVREVLESDPLADGATTALLAVPIASAGTLAGTLVVRRLRAEGFTVAEQGVLDRLARMTGASLDAIARRGALAGDEDLDPVTGLVRRERMLVDLRTAVRTRAEHDLPVSLVLAEVDGLARMRTEYGDGDADEALRLIATTLNSQLRVGDIAYRHGEDDVAVLLPATELDDAEIVAGRLAGAAEQILAERFQLPRPLRLRTAAVPVEEDAAKTLEQAIILLGAERNHERQVMEAEQRRRLAVELEQR